MRVVVSDFISLDGVVQAPGGPDEDTDGGFGPGPSVAERNRLVAPRALTMLGTPGTRNAWSRNIEGGS